jgi:A/G-specific adenine glycosylase
MLQQTQVARVVEAYARFLKRFPSARALAHASLGEVLRVWSGLGYNRRARDLHRIALLHPAGVPRSVADLDALPGVGGYTAAAVACFAHGDAVAFAETNIRRVLGRAVLGRAATEREAVAIDARLMPRRRARDWHHALMDVGAIFCRSREPRCGECPLRPVCRYSGAKRSSRTVGRQGRTTTYRGAAERERRRQAPFATSDRRIRGAIVRALTTSPRTVAGLRRLIGDRRVPHLVGALATEGLVETTGTRVRLPS